MSGNTEEMTRITVYLPFELKRKLQHRAIDRKITMSELVTKVASRYFNKIKKNK